MTEPRNAELTRSEPRPIRRGVIGLGNPFRGDDGIVRALFDRLESREHDFDATFVDLGDGNFRLLHALSEFDTVLIVDAVEFGGDPGEHVVFDPEDVVSRRAHSGSHDSNLLELLSLAEQVGETPPDVTIFGIQPADVSMGAGLSEPLERRLPDLTEALGDTIKQL